MYVFVDFKYFVSKWYNEFLPIAFNDKIDEVESAGILYLNSISLEPRKSDSIKFIAHRIIDEFSPSDENVIIVVRESKPIDNPMMMKTIEWVEKSKLNSSIKMKIRNLSNRRYVSSSDKVFISQDGEIDCFFEQLFSVLMKLDMDNVRFCDSQSLSVNETYDVARSFFPKSQLRFFKGGENGNHINVMSSNCVLGEMFDKLKWRFELDSSASNFLENNRNSLMRKFEEMV